MPAFNSRLSSFPIIFLSRSCQDKDRKQMPQTPRLSQYNTCMEESVCDHESDHQVPKLKEAKMMSKIDEDGLEQLTKHLVRGASSQTLPSPSSVKGEHSLRWQGLTAHGQLEGPRRCMYPQLGPWLGTSIPPSLAAVWQNQTTVFTDGQRGKVSLTAEFKSSNAPTFPGSCQDKTTSRTTAQGEMPMLQQKVWKKD